MLLANINPRQPERRSLAQRILGKDPLFVPIGGMRRQFGSSETPRHFLHGALVFIEVTVGERHDVFPPA